VSFVKIGPRKAILFLEASGNLPCRLCHKTAWHLMAAERDVSLSTAPRSAALAAFFYCTRLPIMWCFKARMTPASSVLWYGATWPYCWHPWVIMPSHLPPRIRLSGAVENKLPTGKENRLKSAVYLLTSMNTWSVLPIFLVAFSCCRNEHLTNYYCKRTQQICCG